MRPSQYYYGQFRKHFAAFWRSLDAHGSVSRVRQCAHPTRFSEQGAEHFSVVDLVVRPGQGFKDHLAEVPHSDQSDFLCALFYTVLIDQVMYAHRQSDYSVFRALTRYPKMDRTVGYARTLTMANPYELFEDDVVFSRGIQRDDLFARFPVWAEFIVEDLSSFFEQHNVGTSDWPQIREAILCDPSCTWGPLGMLLTQALQSGAPPNAL